MVIVPPKWALFEPAKNRNNCLASGVGSIFFQVGSNLSEPTKETCLTFTILLRSGDDEESYCAVNVLYSLFRASSLSNHRTSVGRGGLPLVENSPSPFSVIVSLKCGLHLKWGRQNTSLSNDATDICSESYPVSYRIKNGCRPIRASFLVLARQAKKRRNWWRWSCQPAPEQLKKHLRICIMTAFYQWLT